MLNIGSKEPRLFSDSDAEKWPCDGLPSGSKAGAFVPREVGPSSKFRLAQPLRRVRIKEEIKEPPARFGRLF